MQYTGENCPICGAAFTESDDVVVCPDCGTPHHRSCYFAHGVCANADKHVSGFEWSPTDKADAASDAAKAPQNTKETVVCPRCGTQNAAEEPVCTNCGARLYFGAAPTPRMPQAQLPDWSNSPYVTRGTLISPEETIGGNTVRDTAQYVQASAHRYIPKFYTIEKTGKKISWNWAAFFFAPYWFFYRKLYAVGSIFLVLLLAATAATATPRYMEASYAASEAMAQYMEGEDRSESAFSDYREKMVALYRLPETMIAAGVSFAVRLFAGLYGNTLYKRRVEEQVRKLTALTPAGEGRRLLLLRQGGVSLLMTLLSVLLYQVGGQCIYLAISAFLM